MISSKIEMSFDQFWKQDGDHTMSTKLAAFLNIDLDKLKITNILPGSSSGRRRLAAESTAVYITISEEPLELTTDNP